MDWLRAGARVRRTRVLRWPQAKDFAAHLGISVRLLHDVEAGRRDGHVSARTVALVEDALGWQPGSLERIAQGGEPIIERDPLLARVESAWPMLDEQARRILAELAERSLDR